MINRYFLICLLSLSMGIIFYVYESNILLLTQIIVLGILFMLKRRNIFLISIIVTLCGLLVTGAYLNPSDSMLINFTNQKCDGTFKITDINYESANYILCKAKIIKVDNKDCNENINLYIYKYEQAKINGIYDFKDMKLYLQNKKDMLKYGNKNFFNGTVSGGNVDFKKIDNRTIGDKIKNLQTKANEYILSIFSKDTGALICALYTGETRYISFHHKNIFSLTGISHILSVSGMHVIILMSVFGMLFDRMGKIKYLKYLVLFIFVIFTGASPAIIRAAFLYTFSAIGQIIKRSYDSINILSLIALITLIFDPLLLFNKSFQLSYIATYAVIAVSPLFYIKSDYKFFDFFSKAVSITLAAQILTLPVTLTFNSQITLTSLSANVIASLFTLIIYPISFVAMIVPFKLFIALSELTVNFLYQIIEILYKGDFLSYTFLNSRSSIIMTSVLSIILFLITVERKNRLIRKDIKKLNTLHK